MSNHRNSTPAPDISSEGAPVNKKSAAEKALLDLEAQICDIYAMVHVSSLLFEDLIEKPFMGDKLKFVSSYEMDMLSFACHDLVGRASSLRNDFYAAAHGKDA
ncbi:hypothetical protein [Rhizobium sp. AP16]|uniref:hypothetical protein n=1 Tax=Rhizobium sp. AP16 TaxID=1144306 RepID=UPI00026ED263|nr:hypothetical protein [Rhizobium sp. AP16]EJK83560.1 hypothetical protein PMI03_03215 [Rhizobium sp. AP16]